MAEEPFGTPATGSEEGKNRRFSLPVGVVAGLVFAAAVFVAMLLLSSSQPSAEPEPLSQESLDYASHVTLSGLHMTAEENFLGQEVVSLNGKIANAGEMTVRRLGVRLYFYDVQSQIALQEERAILSLRSVPLAPGGTRDFQLRFDVLPQLWNRQPPQFQLISLEIE